MFREHKEHNEYLRAFSLNKIVDDHFRSKELTIEENTQFTRMRGHIGMHCKRILYTVL